MTRHSILFILRGLTLEGGVIVEKDAFALVETSMFVRDVRGKLSEVSSETSYLSVLRELRKVLGDGDYDRAQGLRHPDFVLPSSRGELSDLLHFQNWPGYVVMRSQVKGLERRIYRKKDGQPRVSIAETLLPNGHVRETEVILERSDYTGWDFYAYGENGHRSLRSTFVSKTGKEVTSAVPYSCMTCHFDSARKQFQNLPKSYRP